MTMSNVDDLHGLVPAHDNLVGVDSDGCVFDTMEIKQKQCFHPAIVAHWGLEAVAPAVHETAQFVNLYSRGRGRNRFISLVEVFDLLVARPDVTGTGVALPRLAGLRRLIDSGVALGNPALARAVAASDDPELAGVLRWSEEVNVRIAALGQSMPPFPSAVTALAAMQASSDVIVVSQTPAAALVREWTHSGLVDRVRVIAGQELGTKAEHLAFATHDRYRPDRVLMVGDAPGDLAAARANAAAFYPINPAHEEASWQRFCTEAYPRFLAGTYRGEYEARCTNEFLALLPATPPWQQP